MSPGRVKPLSDARARLAARPTPVSSIPPHQTGIPRYVFEPSFWEEHPVRTVSSYERPLSYEEGSGPKATDDKVLEQLRALGYVGP